MFAALVKIRRPSYKYSYVHFSPLLFIQREKSIATWDFRRQPRLKKQKKAISIRAKMKQRTRTTGNADASAHGVESVHSDRNNKRATKKMKFQQKLLKFESLPDYMQDNEFIRDHYRCEWPLKYVVLSVFSVHNETLNIWTWVFVFLIFFPNVTDRPFSLKKFKFCSSGLS